MLVPVEQSGTLDTCRQKVVPSVPCVKHRRLSEGRHPRGFPVGIVACHPLRVHRPPPGPTEGYAHRQGDIVESAVGIFLHYRVFPVHDPFFHHREAFESAFSCIFEKTFRDVVGITAVLAECNPAARGDDRQRQSRIADFDRVAVELRHPRGGFCEVQTFKPVIGIPGDAAPCAAVGKVPRGYDRVLLNPHGNRLGIVIIKILHRLVFVTFPTALDTLYKSFAMKSERVRDRVHHRVPVLGGLGNAALLIADYLFERGAVVDVEVFPVIVGGGSRKNRAVNPRRKTAVRDKEAVFVHFITIKHAPHPANKRVTASRQVIFVVGHYPLVEICAGNGFRDLAIVDNRIFGLRTRKD